MSLAKLSKKFDRDEGRLVLVTETTRMGGGLVCVAGLDINSGDMVRPLQGDGSNWSESEWVDTGYMVVGNVLSLPPAHAGNPAYPHANEDFRVKSVRIQGQASASELYAACAEASDQDIDAIFGDCLVERKYTVADSKCRSLGGIEISARRLEVSTFYNKTQVSFQDRWKNWYNLPVTELLTKNEGDTEAGTQALAARLASAGWQNVILRLGLTRAWDGGPQGFDPKRCFLQLNGVILPD